jgi:hypothetical protein
VSAAAERLFDDDLFLLGFVLARTGRAPGAGQRRGEAPGAPDPAQVSAERGAAQALRLMVKLASFARSKEGQAAHLDYGTQRPERGLRPGRGRLQRHRRTDGPVGP